MGKIGNPRPVKLFAGVISSIPEMFPKVEAGLAALFGPVDLRSEAFPFDATRYYDEDMGSPLQRCFYSFAEFIAPPQIAAIKIRANQLEESLAAQCTLVRRPVNIDPGYLEESKIVLASTKNFYHRILISDGIYAEVTMRYQDGGWCLFPWTFPDFRNDRYHSFFSEMRRAYRSRLKSMD